MQEQKIDRRVQRTEQLLRDTLIALILEKGFDAITIQDILDRANMGRSTFYAHYRDKEDLLMSGFGVLFDAFRREYLQTALPEADPVQTGKDLSLFLFRHAGTHRGLFRAMIGEQGGKIIQEHTLAYMTKLINEAISARLTVRQKETPVDVLAYFIASSYLSMLTWWLDHDLPYTAEQMNTLFLQLVIPGAREMLGAG